MTYESPWKGSISVLYTLLGLPHHCVTLTRIEFDIYDDPRSSVTESFLGKHPIDRLHSLHRLCCSYGANSVLFDRYSAAHPADQKLRSSGGILYKFAVYSHHRYSSAVRPHSGETATPKSTTSSRTNEKDHERLEPWLHQKGQYVSSLGYSGIDRGYGKDPQGRYGKCAEFTWDVDG